MIALEPVIVERLRASLADAWVVKGMFFDDGRRSGDLFASVTFADADVPASEDTGAMVRPLWLVTLVAKGTDANVAAQLDSAFAIAVEALHGWAPGPVGGRRWERFRLARVKPPPYLDTGLVGIELGFSTSARFDGQP
ncbi:hypothetical protein [Variovorax sp. tm]|uniref:hypothetical protein n=1 Tax=Variovorax atrisoli TaxID=3394203 RepID=UPI003A7FF89B